MERGVLSVCGGTRDCSGQETLCWFLRAPHMGAENALPHGSGHRQRSGSSRRKRECAKEVFHQRDGIAKSTEIIFPGQQGQLAEGCKENGEMEAGENK